MTDPMHDLAEDLFDTLLDAAPFMATTLGMPGHDADVPDASAAGDAAMLAALDRIEERVALVPADSLDASSRITAECIRETTSSLRAGIAAAAVEHVVTPMPFAGPAVLLAIAARTTLPDAGAAADYLTRLERSGAWVDQLCDRLREGAAKGRVPIASQITKAVAWADELLAAPVPPALLAPQPPADWDGTPDWRDRVQAVATEVVKPAFARWRDLLTGELLPVAREDSAAGLSHIPRGSDDYLAMIRVHTTLDLTPEELHASGLAEIERLETRALALGAELRLDGLPEIHAAMREAATSADTTASIAAAVTAIRRAEAVAAEIFPAPLPEPCAVTPMPVAVAASGMAPHYTRPLLDGSRPGTYWFNTMRPTAGTGWDLEAVAFHEAVPGHHLQLSRAQLLTGLPRLQSNYSVTAHSEGWGLYAEQLAGEVGLYTDAKAELGAIAASLMRAARLVLDTGLHALGWSRAQALEFYRRHVPLPEGFLADEIDRYLTVPGQALAYQTGKFEILRLRELAKAQLGDRFSLPEFHARVLDHGSIPLPVLRTAVDDWIGSV